MATMMDLRIDLQPITAQGTAEPFAWHAGIHARPHVFHTVDAILPREDRAELEAARLDRAFAAAAEAGLVAAGTLLVVPVQLRAAAPDRLLTHLFRAALRHRFPLDRVVVEISADESADRDAAGLRHFQGELRVERRVRRYTRPMRPWGMPGTGMRIAA